MSNRQAWLRQADALATRRCPACGGPWRPNLNRYWHTGHPADCSRKIAQMRQDEEARALRGNGGMLVKECGCRGTEHSRTTCLRWFAFHPEEEIGEEYAGGDL